MDFQPSARCLDFEERLTRVHGRARLSRRRPCTSASCASPATRHQSAADHGGAQGHARASGGCGTCSCPTPSTAPGSPTATTRRSPRSSGAATSPRRRATARRPTPATWRCCTCSPPRSSASGGSEPLLDGEIRSAFAMTEPDVASSDATNIALRIERDGDRVRAQRAQVVDLRRAAPALPGDDRDGQDAHRTARATPSRAMVLVPLDTPGVTVVRGLPVFGYQDHEGHAEILFEDVRVPAANLIAGEGEGFMIAQARLGPGRIHHCMRSLGAAERALEAMCARAVSRVTFGEPLAARANIQDWIAESRDRDRDGAPADAEGRVADGHRRQPRMRAPRSPRSRSPRQTSR